MLVIARVLVLLTAAACGPPAARLSLVPVELPGSCGKPAAADVTTITVTAYHEGSDVTIALDPDATSGVPLDALPGDTEQLAVAIGDDSGVLAAGKTAPLALGSLANGATIPIVVLPMLGFCRTAGDPLVARTAPLVAHAGNGVLIVGGTTSSGQSSSAEYYDAGTGTFDDVQLPLQLPDEQGFLGASLAELDDGTVLVTGPDHLDLVFDPATREFSENTFAEIRAFHASAAFDADHVLIAGGCTDIAAGACSNAIPSVHEYPIAQLGDLAAAVAGPQLMGGEQDSAQLMRLGAENDGSHAFVIAGSLSNGSVANRIEWESLDATEIDGMNAQLAVLPGGALLSAFAKDGSPQNGAAGVLPPTGDQLVPVATGPALDQQRLVALEDGTVLAAGVVPATGAGSFALYSPNADAWPALAPVTAANAVTAPAIAAPTLVRLADGSVLVLGGTPPAANAWLYRPSLLGAASGSAPADGAGSGPGVLVPSDPSTVTAGFELTGPASDSPDDLTARALFGAPLTTNGSLVARVAVASGAVALIAQQVAPGRALVAELVPGMPARIFRRDGAAEQPSCTGETVQPFDGTMVQLELDVSGQSADLTLGGMLMVHCSLSGDADAADRGAWGIAAAGAGSRVMIENATLQR